MALTKAKASNILLTTPAASSNDTTPATTEYVTTAINNLINGAPATLNTLDEIAAALNDDAALNTTLTNAIAAKLPLAGGTMTGTLTLDTGSSGVPTINLSHTNAGADNFRIMAGVTGISNGGFSIYDVDASTNRLIIDGNGNVGLGLATSPSAPLDVITNSTLWVGEFTQNNTSNGDGVIITVGSTSQADYALSVRSNAGNTPGLNVKADGTVGIGTTSPSGLLEVSGSAPTFILNANTQGTNKKKIRLAASQFTSGDFNIQQMNDDGTTVALNAMTIANGGNASFAGTITSNINSAIEYSTTEAAETSLVGSDALALMNNENSSTNGKVSLFMKNTGGGGAASGRITLKNNRSGSSGFGFFLRDNSHTTEQKEKMFLDSDGNATFAGSIVSASAIQASSNLGANAAFQIPWENSAIGLRMMYDSNYYMSIETHAQTRDLILNNKAADGAGDIRFNTGVTLTERLAIKADGKIELASTSYVEKPFRILYNGTSTATQYMKIYDKAGSVPPKNLHFLMYGQNHSEYSVEVKMHIPTYSGFYSSYGTPDQGMGPTVEIDCGGLPNQTNIFQEIIAYSPVTDANNYTEIWLKITPPHSTTNIYVREYADSDLLIQTPSWTTTAPGITRSFPILKGHRSINTTHIGRDGDVEIRDGSLRQSGAPGFKVYDAGFTKNSGWHNISPELLTVEYNNNTSGWNSSNGRFTPTKAGYYLFTFGGWANSASDGSRYATSFAKNGSLKFISGSQYNLVDSPMNGHSEVIYMNGSTDYVDLYAYSAIVATWGGGSHSIWWGAEWIH